MDITLNIGDNITLTKLRAIGAGFGVECSYILKLDVVRFWLPNTDLFLEIPATQIVTTNIPRVLEATFGLPSARKPDDNVTRFTGLTKLDLDPDLLLDQAKGQMERVIIIGFTKTGEEYLAFSDADMAHAVYDIERAKLALLREWDKE